MIVISSVILKHTKNNHLTINIEARTFMSPPLITPLHFLINEKTSNCSETDGCGEAYKGHHRKRRQSKTCDFSGSAGQGN